MALRQMCVYGNVRRPSQPSQLDGGAVQCTPERDHVGRRDPALRFVRDRSSQARPTFRGTCIWRSSGTVGPRATGCRGTADATGPPAGCRGTDGTGSRRGRRGVAAARVRGGAAGEWPRDDGRGGAAGEWPRDGFAAGPRRSVRGGQSAAARISDSASVTRARMLERIASRPVQTAFVAVEMEVSCDLS